jgi:hypothetical protein
MIEREKKKKRPFKIKYVVLNIRDKTNVFNLVKERIYFMLVARGHSMKKTAFIHIEQQTRTERVDNRKKNKSWILIIYILNCLSNGLNVDTDN